MGFFNVNNLFICIKPRIYRIVSSAKFASMKSIFMSLLNRKMFVSSANNLTFSSGKTFEISFMNRNNKGPNIDP